MARRQTAKQRAWQATFKREAHHCAIHPEEGKYTTCLHKRLAGLSGGVGGRRKRRRRKGKK
jgi:hypothetical protein